MIYMLRKKINGSGRWGSVVVWEAAKLRQYLATGADNKATTLAILVDINTEMIT
jgi:hypothetical protein